MDDAAEKIQAWNDENNSFRLHSSLDEMTPNEVVNKYQKSPKSLQ